MTQTCKIIKQVLAAVEYCHKRRIVHRDLKPDNIVFEYEDIDSTLKVIDFGNSKLLKPRERLTEQTGSCFYIAPEILLRKAYNEKCDVWSCGVILYLMLCGRPPFYSTNAREVLEQILEGKVKFEGKFRCKSRAGVEVRAEGMHQSRQKNAHLRYGRENFG
eukprot:TRINITY_DN5405_c0_g1_i2.p4 TRINITY_DN5405_c0_g1~~TRINITY_DN5405_c0_g1_i2.p4  ORF type:complete len:161 (+),score=40.83 TRINITY_DN5405_c0_g1_i2:219-701(+)